MNLKSVKNGSYFQGNQNSQKTSSRCYNFNSNLRGTKSNDTSMANIRLNLLNGGQGNSDLIKDMISVRSGVKQKLTTGISDYVR